MFPGKRYTPETVWRIVRRRKWIVLVPFILIASGTAVVAHYLPNRYRSDTLVLAVPQQVPKDYVQPTVTARIEDRLSAINTQILSRTRLEEMVREFDLYAKERKTAIMEDVIEQMRTRDIKVQIGTGSPNGSPTVRIAYTGTDPKTVMRVTERLASFFIEENLRDRAALAEGTNQFLEVQLHEARNRLIEQEKRLESYRQKFAGQLPSELNTNMQAIQSLQLQLQTLAQSASQDSDRRLQLDRLLAEAEAQPLLAVAPGQATADGQVNEAVTAPLPPAQQLELARERLRALELRLKPAHPDLVRARRAVGELERKVDAAALEQSLSPSDTAGLTGLTPQEYQRQLRIREMKAQRDILVRRIAEKEAEDKRLRAVLSGYQARIAAIPARETELVELTRDYETLRAIYTNLLAKSETARAAADLERRQIGEQFKLLDPARLPERPISPNRLQINSVGAAVGLGVGLGLLLLLEYRDSTLRTEADVLDALSLPVLALVPWMMSVAERERRARRRRSLRLVLVATLLLVVGGAVIAWRFGLAEQWAALGRQYVVDRVSSVV
jgi:polysaccharide chain length determinant protein (PEP-CTERM system associated)